MKNYEALGRYVALEEEARAKRAERNNLLDRAAAVLKNAAQPATGTFYRPCNFAAAEELLTEARTADAALAALLDEINTLAPLADRPALR